VSTLTDSQTVERFHLLFLQQIGTRFDKKLYSLKGGCNLRFFFRSIRYSEDLDLDVQTMAKQTLRKNVNQILKFQGFLQILRANGLSLSFVSEPKQTDTTQRWKIHLRLVQTGAELPTKIEFSRRSFREGVALEPVDATVASLHRLRPILTPHYTLEAAFAQKIEALVGRSKTQARDVFDLKLLFDAGAKATSMSAKTRLTLRSACDNAISVTYADFKGEVVAYLEPEYQKFYGQRAEWEKLQAAVSDRLRNL